MDYTKTITPHYETIGRRQKFTGVIGQLTDESGVVLHSKEYSNYGEAEVALDAIKYDLLMDLAERGLSDTVPYIEVEGLRVMAPTDCEPPILDDVVDVLIDTAQVLDMALGATHGAASVVAELQRVRARIGQVQARATVLG